MLDFQFGDIHVHLVVRIFLEDIWIFLKFRIKTHIFFNFYDQNFLWFHEDIMIILRKLIFKRSLPEWLLGGMIQFNINMLSVQHCCPLLNFFNKLSFFFKLNPTSFNTLQNVGSLAPFFQVMIKRLIWNKKKWTRHNFVIILSFFCLIKRPCVAGAVLQTPPLLINWLSQSSFSLQLWSSIRPTCWSWTGVTSLT